MSHKAKTSQEFITPDSQTQKKSSKKAVLQKLEGMFSDLEVEQIPEPQPVETTDQKPDISLQLASAMMQNVDQLQLIESEELDTAIPKSFETIPTTSHDTLATRKTPVSRPAIQVISSPDEEEITPAPPILDPIALKSFSMGHPVAETTQKDQPAKLAYARLTGGVMKRKVPDTIEGQEVKSETIHEVDHLNPQTLLLEVLDRDPNRSWSDEEISLLEQVTDQLTSALENARLFQESQNRAEQLSILNEMARQLSTQLNVDEVLETIYDYTSRLIDSTNFCVALYKQESNQITFPLGIEDNHRIEKPIRFLANGLIDQVINSQQPLLINFPFLDEEKEFNDTKPVDADENSLDEEKVIQLSKENSSAGFEKVLPGVELQPLSWLGVPMIYGRKVIGAIAVQSFNQAFLFDQSHQDLLVAIASQSVVAIQNARLFGQTRFSLTSLEVSERYQKGVARAVSLLIERGITALSDVLEILGKASQTSRVCYIETLVDQRGPYWRLIAEWRSENTTSQFDNPELRRFSKSWLASRYDNLRRYGFLTSTTNTTSPEETDILKSLGARSFLLLAVPGRYDIPGCISFEQIDFDRTWSEDEIAALQIAASSLANTLAREDSFTQVQINLSETEAMYQASARINSASNYQEILNVLRQYTILGNTNTYEITIHLFDKPWIKWPDAIDKPERLIPIAQWNAHPDSDASKDEHQVGSWKQISMTSWKESERLLHPERPIIVHDIDTDPRFADSGRRMYPGLLEAKSLISVPLNLTRGWIGHIIAMNNQATGFSEQEGLRLILLANQAAVAIESLRILDETRKHNEDLAIINHVISATSKSLELQPVLEEILREILAAIGYESGLFSLFDTPKKQLRLIVHENVPDGMIDSLTHNGMVKATCDLILQNGVTVYIPDLSNIPDEISSWQGASDGLKSEGFSSYLGVPVKSKGETLGTICAFNKSVKPIKPQRLSLVETIGQQITIVIDNALAYELSQKTVMEISEAERVKTQFLANTSHELRTPLNSIIGYSRVILKGIDGPVNELQTQDLTAIYNSGQHLLGLINGILDLSKIEAGKMELTFEDKVDLAEIIKSCLSTITGLVKDKPIEFVVDIDPDLPLLTIDPIKIRQVLLNLLSNAVNFTEKGSITLTANRQVGTDGETEVIVRVIDTGLGITPGDQAKLFLPYSQVDGSSTRSLSGSGLGLSICQALVQLHNGRLGVESEMDKGSNFFFILPVNQPERSEKELKENLDQFSEQVTHPLTYDSKYSTLFSENATYKSVEGTTAEVTLKNISQLTILSIDPSLQVTELYKRYLEDLNFSVVALTDLDLVIDAVRKHQPFAITLDVAMKSTSSDREGSSLDGWDILEALKSNPDTKKIPIIICSIQTNQEKAIGMGAADYLLKPILKEDLAQAVHNLLSRR